ncbi:MAG TPA: SDR family oxidoreductase [Pseudonocardiaceae bacterium]|nr:SDR family oxidoreductase [Pseudonocardiaceae bacterium]
MSNPRRAQRPVVLVTGASRRAGIASATALRLAEAGWDVAITHHMPYDTRMPWGADDGAVEELLRSMAGHGARAFAMAADFAQPDEPERVFDEVIQALGPVTALVLGHAESVNSTIMDTELESFDRHFAVNTRSNWLLIREFARTFKGAFGTGRIIALTSDAVVGEIAYGASKAALDRIVLAAAIEFAPLGITANCVNPGPTDNGWLTEDLRTELTARTPLGRLGLPRDAANLVAFLCSAEGGWINRQVLNSNGGFDS